MARYFIAILALIVASAITPLRAQDTLAGRLALGRIGDIQTGAYLAGDNVKFTLSGNGGTFLLRFDGNPEVFVLYTAHASLGGRELKYDSGETALQVAGWGGITLYTDSQPTGLPAVRTGDAIAPSPPSVSLSEMQSAADDEAEHLAYMRGLRLNVTADWNAIGSSPAVRAFAFDAMENMVRGLDRFSYAAPGREALSHHVDTVMLETSGKPTITLNAHTLIVTFNPGHGYEGRASSRAIARALSSVLPRH